MEFPFIIRCQNCGWKVFSTGTSLDIKTQNLMELKKNCSTCGGPRVFRCKKCGKVAKMFRMRNR